MTDIDVDALLAEFAVIEPLVQWEMAGRLVAALKQERERADELDADMTRAVVAFNAERAEVARLKTSLEYLADIARDYARRPLLNKDAEAAGRRRPKLRSPYGAGTWSVTPCSGTGAPVCGSGTGGKSPRPAAH